MENFGLQAEVSFARPKSLAFRKADSLD